MSGRQTVERSNSNARVARGARSDVLKRLGGALSVEGCLGNPLTATVSLPLAVETQDSEEADEPCGLTPASLKHLKRQRDALQEDKQRLQAELLDTVKQLKELRSVLPQLKAQLDESQAEQQRLLTALEAAEQQWRRAEQSLAASEEEVARLREQLEQQRRLTAEVCEAAGRKNQLQAQMEKDMEELQALVQQLKSENKQLLEEQVKQAQQHEEMKRNVVVAMAAAEKAMQMHQQHHSQLEMLRAAKLAEAINQKVELHIAVPKVTLTYNDAPPLLISVAQALGEEKLQKFLDQEVFPHFEPLWVRLDGLDLAPDGSSKKAYSSRMLDRLTQAVKTFLSRSQGEEKT